MPAGGNVVSWGGRTTFQEPRPDGNRYAQSQWQFNMSGTIGQEAPHAAYFSMSGDQQHAFDSPGRLPFSLFAPIATGGSHAPTMPSAQRVIEIEASTFDGPPRPPPHPAAQPACSQCGTGSSSLKKIRTHGGLMRLLCNNCVYDMAGGDQQIFARTWADGCPL
jgi:hypothetical protein